jgi:tetratricopeptide (TPR) repeat protein
MIVKARFGGLVVAALLLIPPAAAQEAKIPELDRCLGGAGATYEQIVRVCTAVIQTKRLPPEELARAYEARGYAYSSVNWAKSDQDAAIADYTQAIRLNPTRARTFQHRGVAYLEKNNTAAAIADLTEAIRLDPRADFAFSNRAEAYRRKGDLPRALADLDQAVRLTPQQPLQQTLHFRLRGDFHLDYSDPALAIRDYSEWIRLDSADSRSWSSRCLARAVAGQGRAAIEDCSRALKSPTHQADALSSMGFAFLKMGELDRAIGAYDRALRNEPNNAFALYGRGLAKLKKGDAGGNADTAAAKAILPEIAARYARYGIR